MDLKTRLEDEELFCIGSNGKNRVPAVNKKGVYTVEDFLNCDVDYLSSSNKQYRVLKDVISCKYKNTPLLRSVYLDRTVSRDNVINIMYNELGFKGIPNDLHRIIKDLSTSEIKMIDVLRYISNDERYAYKPLIDFYVSYYDNNHSKDETKIDNNNNLKNARDEISFLLNLRERVDARITELNDQNDKEKRSSNARK